LWKQERREEERREKEEDLFQVTVLFNPIFLFPKEEQLLSNISAQT